jgi:thiaminase
MEDYQVHKQAEEHTSKYHWQSDNSAVIKMKCTIPVPELYYCSTAPYRIISPQHVDIMWRKAGLGTFQECTNGIHTKVEWEDEYGDVHVKTVTYTTLSGVPVCATAPSYRHYQNYLAKHQDSSNDEMEMVAFMSTGTTYVSEYEQPISYDISVRPTKQEYQLLQDFHQTKELLKEVRDEPIKLDFHDDELQETVVDEVDEMTEMSAKTEKLFWHYKLGHTPFSAINRMAECGE